MAMASNVQRENRSQVLIATLASWVAKPSFARDALFFVFVITVDFVIVPDLTRGVCSSMPPRPGS